MYCAPSQYGDAGRLRVKHRSRTDKDFTQEVYISGESLNYGNFITPGAVNVISIAAAPPQGAGFRR